MTRRLFNPIGRVVSKSLFEIFDESIGRDTKLLDLSSIPSGAPRSSRLAEVPAFQGDFSRYRHASLPLQPQIGIASLTHASPATPTMFTLTSITFVLELPRRDTSVIRSYYMKRSLSAAGSIDSNDLKRLRLSSRLAGRGFSWKFTFLGTAF